MIWIILILVHPAQGEIQNHSLEIIKGNTTLNAGSELQLKCNIETDVTDITFKWFKDNSEISDETSQTLTIISITKDQAGVYFCSVKNGTDPEKLSPIRQTITVNYLENAVLTISPTVLTNDEGDSVTFTCGVVTNLNSISYSFKKDGNVIATDGNNEYVISKVMKSDSGSYTCTVSASTPSPVSVISSNSVSLAVNELFQTPTLAASSNNLNSGESFTLTCTTSSPRNIAYKFLKGTANLTQFQQSPIYSITAQFTDRGLYTCIAQVNNVEKVSPQVYVEVTLKVSITITPTIEGQNMIITCNVEDGEKAQSFSWKKNSVSVTGQTSKTLVVQNVHRSMIGTKYSCIGTSQASTPSNEASATLSNANIYYKASELLITPSDKNEGKVGEIFSTTCYASDYGNPLATLAWYRNGSSTALSTGNADEQVSHTINPVRRDSTGDYICKANNKAGEVEKTFPLTAIEKPDPPSLRLLSTTSTSITVLIAPPTYTGNKPITYYTLQYQGNGKDISKNKANSTHLVFNITELEPAVKYQVRVQAVNVIGAGKFSGFIIAKTEDDHMICLSCMANCNAEKTKKTTDDSQPAKIIIVSVLVTLVITLVIITIAFLILKQKGLITVNKKRNEKPQNVETDDYEVAGTTHYADLHIQDVKPSFYTDLKTMNDQSNDYAEIELNETQKNIYANVKK